MSELWTLSPCILNPFASSTIFLKAKPPPHLSSPLLSVGLEPSPILSEDHHSILSRLSLIPFHPIPPLPLPPPPPRPLGPKPPQLTLPPTSLRRRELLQGGWLPGLGGHPPWSAGRGGGSFAHPKGSVAVGCACPNEGPPWWVTRGWGCHVCVRWVGFRERCVYHILLSGEQCGFPLAPPPSPTFLLEPPSLARSREGRGGSAASGRGSRAS